MATGLTMKAAILDLKSRNPSKIVVAIPVAPKDTVEEIAKTVDEIIVLDAEEFFLGSIGAYYDVFGQVSDEEVVEMMRSVIPVPDLSFPRKRESSPGQAPAGIQERSDGSPPTRG